MTLKFFSPIIKQLNKFQKKLINFFNVIMVAFSYLFSILPVRLIGLFLNKKVINFHPPKSSNWTEVTEYKSSKKMY